MSLYSIQLYHKELEKIIHYGGSKKETAIRNAFYNLLNKETLPNYKDHVLDLLKEVVRYCGKII